MVAVVGGGGFCMERSNVITLEITFMHSVVLPVSSVLLDAWLLLPPSLTVDLYVQSALV